MVKQTGVGIDSLCRAHHGAHYCLLYQSEDDLVDLLADYFQYGLESNEYCIWVVADSNVEKKARRALSKIVPATGNANRKDSIEFATAGEWYLKGGSFQAERVSKSWYDKLNYSKTHGYKGMRVTGDLGWYDETVWPSLMEYEMRLNDVIPQEKLVAMCSYPLEKLSASRLIDVAHRHQRAIVKNNGNWQIFETLEVGKAISLLSKRVNKAAVTLQAEQAFSLPALYPDICNGCALCISVCQQGLLHLRNGKIAIMNSANCDWCTNCEAVCPTGAIACQFEIILPGSL